MNTLTSLPIEVHRSAQRGELQKVVKWLNKGGAVGALCSFPSTGGRPSTTTLLQTAAANGHVAMVSELLRGVRLFLDFVYCVTGPRARELL